MRRLPSLGVLRPNSLPAGWRAAFREIPVALATVIEVRLGLTFASLDAVRRSLLPDRLGCLNPELAEIVRIAWSVQIASRLTPFASCLTQAQAAQILLARRGYASTLCLGVQPAPKARVRAHAWLVCSDRIIVGGDAKTIASFSRIAELGPVSR